MKRIIASAMAAVILTACTPQGGKTTSNLDEPTTITWIEDKPGPMLQEHQLFPTVPDTLWEALGLQEGVPSSIGCILLKTEGETILIDAGLGAPFSQLIPKLKEAGVSPDRLEHIFISHMHPDHIGGLLKEGKSVFSNAELWINRIEAEAWKAMPEDAAALAHAVMAAYQDHLHLFEAGDTLAGGVLAIGAYGHTPGHTLFQKDSLLIIADLIHGAALQLTHPEYCPYFDMDTAEATTSRKHILQYAQKNNLTLYGMHLPAPGYIERTPHTN